MKTKLHPEDLRKIRKRKITMSKIENTKRFLKYMQWYLKKRTAASEGREKDILEAEYYLEIAKEEHPEYFL